MSYPKFQLPDGKWQCCAVVHRKGMWRGQRCEKIATVNDAWCGIHNPVAAQKRQDKREQEREARYKIEHNQRLARWMGPKLLAVLEQIEKGHNDPRSIAAEILAEYRSKLR